MRCTVTDVERYRKLNKEDYLTGGVLKKGQPPFFCPRKGRRKMSKKAGTALSVMAMVFMGALASPLTVLAADAEETYQPALYATIWALLPPLVAIILALITKEVYSSLFVGIVVGALLYSGFKFEGTVTQIFEGGIIKVLSDSYNVGILIFLVILGSVVCMMNKAGGSAAFGRWASKKIHTRVGAELAAIILGILIFIDDYFNCLTVGSVMRPVTDRHHVSRAKFAYLIDATAAPVCIIAPISSWAAAVSGFVEGQDGLAIFVRTIPYNFYAILTIVMMVGMVLMKTEFGAMRIHEINALNGDLYTTSARPYENATDDETPNPRGRVIDLVIPIVVLVICCVISMIYTGGFFSGTDFVTAFSQSDASTGLAMGSAFGLVFAIIFYMIRRVINFRDCMGCIPEGFKAMVPAIMILTFAWTLSGVTNALGSDDFVKSIVGNSHNSPLLPTILFLIGCGISFATGTSWGTFGILIPIVVNIFPDEISQMMCITIAACLGGAVMGDHCSPISDTTIMASTGGKSDHINHVSTQLPYACLVAVVCLVFYAIASVVQSVIVTPFAIAAMVGILFLMKKLQEKKAPSKSRKA